MFLLDCNPEATSLLLAVGGGGGGGEGLLGSMIRMVLVYTPLFVTSS